MERQGQTVAMQMLRLVPHRTVQLAPTRDNCACPLSLPSHHLGDSRDRHLRHSRVGSLSRVPTTTIARRPAKVEVDCVAARLVDGEDRVAEGDAQLRRSSLANAQDGAG